MELEIFLRSLARQQGLLLGQLVANRSERPNMALIADELFLAFSEGLNDAGVPRQVAADMFGLGIRAYQRRIRKCEEVLSDPEREATLGREVYAYIAEVGMCDREDVLERFNASSEVVISSLLRHMSEMGAIFEVSHQDRLSYMVVDDEGQNVDAANYITSLVGMSSSAVSHTWLLQTMAVGLGYEGAEELLDGLVMRGVLEVESVGGERAYQLAQHDHIKLSRMATAYSFLLTAMQLIVARHSVNLSQVELGQRGYGISLFELWPGHPMEQEVLGVYAQQKDQLQRLRERYNELTSLCPEGEAVYQCNLLMGQLVLK